MTSKRAPPMSPSFGTPQVKKVHRVTSSPQATDRLHQGLASCPPQPYQSPTITSSSPGAIERMHMGLASSPTKPSTAYKSISAMGSVITPKVPIAAFSNPPSPKQSRRPTLPKFLIKREVEETIKNPIVRPPWVTKGAKTLARRGIKLDVLSHAKGIWLSAILTLTERALPSGFFELFKMSEKFTVVIRSKNVDEISLMLRKEIEVFLPAMERCREQELKEWVEATNIKQRVEHGTSAGSPPPSILLDSVDMEDWWMLKTMDGCGPDLNAIMKMIDQSYVEEDDENDDDDEEVDEEIKEAAEEEEEEEDSHLSFMKRDVLANAMLVDKLPLNTHVLKHMSAGTMLKQAHDVAKSHGHTRKLVVPENSLMEGTDEDKLPQYMDAFWAILNQYKIPPESKRTFYWVAANLERHINTAFSQKQLLRGYLISGQGAFSLAEHLNHWPNAASLKEHDWDFIEDNFGFLVDIAKAQGTVFPEDANAIFGEFIYGIEAVILDSDAKDVLAADAIKKPVRDRPVNQWNTTVLTNPKHLENMQIRAAMKLQAKVDAIERKRLDAINAAIKIVEAQEKQLTLQRKRIEAINIHSTNARNVLICKLDDISRADQKETWSKCTAPEITSAFKTFFPNIASKDIPSKKEEKVRKLRILFDTNLPQMPELLPPDWIPDDEGIPESILNPVLIYTAAVDVAAVDAEAAGVAALDVAALDVAELDVAAEDAAAVGIEALDLVAVDVAAVDVAAVEIMFSLLSPPPLYPPHPQLLVDEADDEDELIDDVSLE